MLMMLGVVDYKLHHTLVGYVCVVVIFMGTRLHYVLKGSVMVVTFLVRGRSPPDKSLEIFVFGL